MPYTSSKPDMVVGDIVQVAEMPGRSWLVTEHRYYDVLLVPCQADGTQTVEDQTLAARSTEFWLRSTLRRVDLPVIVTRRLGNSYL